MRKSKRSRQGLLEGQHWLYPVTPLCHGCHGQKPCMCCEFSLALEDMKTVTLKY